jgi:hypothetical protein
MKMMRQRRRARGLRELRLVVADARSRAVRRRVAKQVASLDPDREREALRWIESVSELPNFASSFAKSPPKTLTKVIGLSRSWLLDWR